MPTSAPAGEPRKGADRQLVLYKFDACPYCYRVMRVIDRLGVQVEYRDTRTDPRWRADLVQKTGMTQVPCLFIDGQPMFESADIVEWLQENYG